MLISLKPDNSSSLEKNEVSKSVSISSIQSSQQKSKFQSEESALLRVKNSPLHLSIELYLNPNSQHIVEVNNKPDEVVIEITPPLNLDSENYA